MILPKIHGHLNTSNFIIYCAADELYFNSYGKYLINSIIKNTHHEIHFHLYNPSDATLQWCNKKISVSYEYLNLNILDNAFNRWNSEISDLRSIKRKNDMVKDWTDLTKLKSEIKKTYYACTRFIRLAELINQPQPILLLDVDSLVRSDIVLSSNDDDICIYEKNHKKQVPYMQHLASTIYYTGSEGSYNLINDHANLIKEEYNNNEIYWFLDQDTLDIAIQKYKKKILDISFVDFNFNNDSPIWCAKGPRKFNEIYQNELLKYIA